MQIFFKNFLQYLSIFVVLVLAVVFFQVLSVGNLPGKNVLAQEASTSGNIFGYAWSSNVGWIKMNSCEDENPFDGEPDNPGVCQSTAGGNKPFGVIVRPDGILEGFAWSPHIGWIKFGGNSGFPNGAGNVGVDAELLDVTKESGLLRGWAKAVLGGLTPGFDGWISLSGTNHPTGFTNGNLGVTYHPPTARIVGYAWGGEAFGWINFYDVTFGKPTQTFDFALSANPSSISLPANSEEVGQGAVEIKRQLLDGITEPVTLSVENITPSSPAISAQILENVTCAPTCSSDLVVEVPANTPEETYTVTVKGVSVSGITKTIDVPVVVGVAVPLAATCSLETAPPYFVNNPIVWRAEATGGEAPYTFTWSGTNVVPQCFDFSCQTINGAVSRFTKVYATTGKKALTVAVSSADGGISETECLTPAGDTLLVTVKPSTKEF